MAHFIHLEQHKKNKRSSTCRLELPLNSHLVKQNIFLSFFQHLLGGEDLNRGCAVFSTYYLPLGQVHMVVEQIISFLCTQPNTITARQSFQPISFSTGSHSSFPAPQVVAQLHKRRAELLNKWVTGPDCHLVSLFILWKCVSALHMLANGRFPCVHDNDTRFIVFPLPLPALIVSSELSWK